jgi:hypothetical protein
MSERSIASRAPRASLAGARSNPDRRKCSWTWRGSSWNSTASVRVRVPYARMTPRSRNATSVVSDGSVPPRVKPRARVATGKFVSNSTLVRRASFMASRYATSYRVRSGGVVFSTRVLFDADDPVGAGRVLLEVLMADRVDQARARGVGLEPVLVESVRRSLPKEPRALELACAKGAAWVLGRRSLVTK